MTKYLKFLFFSLGLVISNKKGFSIFHAHILFLKDHKREIQSENVLLPKIIEKNIVKSLHNVF